MKGLAILAALIAVVCAIAFTGVPARAETVATESPIPDMTNEAEHNLKYKVEGVGHTLTPGGDGFNFHCIALAGDALCWATRNFRFPPVGYRLYWCESEDSCTYFRHVEGDVSCDQQIKRGGRYATTEGCVWGVGHTYTLVVTINALGETKESYSSERVLNPDTGRPYPKYQGMVILTEECRKAVKEWRESGEYGPAPECRSRTYLKEQDSPLVPMD